MSGAWRLGLRHAAYHRGRSAILALCIAVSIALPASVRVVLAGFRADLSARAERTPLVVGAKGNRFDLTMSLLYFRAAEVPTISMSDSREVDQARAGVVIPVNLRFTARGRPIVATTPEYYELRGVRVSAGTVPLVLGDVLLGSRVAREWGVGVGGAVFSDQRELFDIAKPQALRMHVVGVLAETGQAEDEAVFVDLKTAWILEGLSHAHVEASGVPEGMVLDRSERAVTLSEALIDFNEVTEANAGSFHLHAAEGQLPVTGLIVVPRSEKEGTILTSRLNAGRVMQAVEPAGVVRDLLAYVLRVRVLLDGVSLLVSGMTGVLLVLVTALSVRVRAREIETYRRLGVSRATVVMVFGSELAVLVAGGVVVAGLITLAASGLGPLLVKLV